MVLNLKVKGKCPGGRPKSRWEQEVRKDVIQREGKLCKNLGAGAMGRQTDGEAWRSHDTFKF